MTTTQTYQGWANYPTWAVNLWLANDEGLYDTVREIVEVEEDDWNEYGAARQLEDFMSELLPAVEGFAGDLLGHAVGMVDWVEIVRSWREDYSDEA